MPQSRDLTAHARRMRLNPTDAESRLWWALRGKQIGAKFRRQMPIGRYIADFACLSHRLIVEVDGSHHGETNLYDRRRNHWMTEHDFQVLRFGNDSVLQELEGVVTVIAQSLAAHPQVPPPVSPPSRGTETWGLIDTPTHS